MPHLVAAGRVTFQDTSFLGMGLQPDGRILAGLIPLFGGASRIARLLSNGSTDTSFGTNGLAFPPGGTGPLEALGNGEILVFGVLISRLTSSGAIDTTFGGNGQLLTQTVGHAATADGDILVAGTLSGNPAVPTSGIGGLFLFERRDRRSCLRHEWWRVGDIFRLSDGYGCGLGPRVHK